MANYPFSQQITNPLERPTSSALNTGFGNYDVQALMQSLSGQDGFVGASFQVIPNASTSTVLLSRGVGFKSGSGGAYYNIGGISGLNDTFDYRVVYTNNRTLDVAPLCASGYIRRDLIMVRPKTTLADSTATDIFEPTTKSFTPASRYHTLSRDFTYEPQYTLAAGVSPTPDQYLVLKMGVPVPATSPNGFLSAPVPSLDAGYMGVAVINMSDVSPVGGYSYSHINDYRELIFADGQASIVGTATIGSDSDLDVGTILANVSIGAPPGFRVAIRKTGLTSNMKYTMYIVAGGGNTPILRMSGNVNLRKIDDSINTGTYSYASFATTTYTDVEFVGTALQAALANTSQTVPAMDVAIGQRVYVYEFTVGAPTYVASVTTPYIVWRSSMPRFGVGGVDSGYTSPIDFHIAIRKF